MTTKEMIYIKGQAEKHRAWAKEERAAAQTAPVMDGDYAYHINECHAHESAADALEHIANKFEQFETETIDELGAILAKVEVRMHKYKELSLEHLRNMDARGDMDAYGDELDAYRRYNDKAQALEEVLSIIYDEMDGKEV